MNVIYILKKKMKLSLDNFSHILEYLNLFDVLKLDNVFTNKELRPYWLLLLSSAIIHVDAKNTIYPNQLEDNMDFWDYVLLKKKIKLNWDYIEHVDYYVEEYNNEYNGENEDNNSFLYMMLANTTNLRKIDICVNYNAIKYIPFILQHNKKIKKIKIIDNIYSHEILQFFTIIATMQNINKIAFGCPMIFGSDPADCKRITLYGTSKIEIIVSEEYIYNSDIANVFTNLQELIIYNPDSLIYDLIINNAIYFPNTLSNVYLSNIQNMEIMKLVKQKIKSLKKIIYSYDDDFNDSAFNIIQFSNSCHNIELIHKTHIKILQLFEHI